jgi:hypothetical protein
MTLAGADKDYSAPLRSAYSPPGPFVDPVHRVPRLWSNAELARVGALFSGDVVNVSAWRDEDKAGRRYRDYFTGARSYAITNYRAEMRGMQGWDGEIFLNLEEPLPTDLKQRFDVVFNHTTLEHVFEFRAAFANLCAMSRDAVILVVPWLQPYHSDYGDYWRFSPLAVAKLFSENQMTPARIVWNSEPGASVYVFAIGVRQADRWRGVFEFDCSAERLMSLKNAAGDAALPKRFGEKLRSAASAAGLGKLRRALAPRRP